MDSVADLTTGVWVEVVATVGVGAVEFTGAVGVGVVGMGLESTLTLYLLLVSTVLLLLSLIFGPGAFLVMGVGILGVGAGVWLWLCWSQLVLLWMDLLQLGLLQLGLGLRPGFGTKHALQFQIHFYLLDGGGVRMEPCAPGIALYNL